ncbi:MAG: ATP-binding cassette domain-containing protein [Alphaproteobacteria bacterium]|nr:ATP-binding cassette domain-containing protein [Alphaproteobacteria bacterium]
MPEPIIEIRGLSKSFGSVRALEDIGFSIGKGEVFTLLGPSGCGKSTTLRIIAGLEDAEAGEIRLAGNTIFSSERHINLPPEKRNMGMVFQSYAIWPHMTVAANVAYPLKLRGVSGADIRDRVARALKLVDLEAQADRDAPKLSGGQQQRVALARALVYEPEVLLLDEPLSNLDVKLREQMRFELKLLQERLGLTLIYVTHDQSEALSLSDRIALMNFGRIEQLGPPRDLYENPATEFVRDFLGKTITLAGRVAALENGGARVELARAPGSLACAAGARAFPAAGTDVMVAIRPEKVRIAVEGGNGGLPGRIETVLYQGERTECLVRVGEELLTIYGPPEAAGLRGRDVTLVLPAEAISLWPR